MGSGLNQGRALVYFPIRRNYPVLFFFPMGRKGVGVSGSVLVYI